MTGSQAEMATELVRVRGMEVAVWLHSDVDPPEDQWRRAVDAFVAELGQGHPMRRGLVISDGGAPNVGQRAMLHEVMHGEARSSIVTTVLSNPIKRGIATALRWINPAFAFFRPEELPRALAYLELGDDLQLIWEVYGRLQRQMRPVKALRTIAELLRLPPLELTRRG